MQTVTTPLGNSTTAYNGKTTTVTTPTGTQTTVLNKAGQATGSTVNGKTVSYDYYASGKAKTATPAGGQPVSMEYDLQGNRTKLTDPAAGVSTALYNGYGELMWEKQTNTATQGEITINYNYNAATGQIESRVRNGETTSYGYDALKRLSTVEIVGQHIQTYTYGAYDRVSNLTELIGSRSFGKQLAYDSYGRVTTTTYPSGYYTLNNYDTYGNLTEVTDGSSRSIWKATQANARGNITTEMKGSKATVYDYDEPKAQLTSMTASGVVDYSFGYDTKNNLLYRSNKLINQKEQFTYDTQNRLTNWYIIDVTANALLKTNSIGYDDLGNISTKSDLDIPDAVTLSYGNTANPHALTSISGKPDAIPADMLDVTYTDFRKIKTLSEGAKQYSITYGVDDQRRRSDYTINGLTKTRYYIGDYEEESDNNGNVKKIHYLSGGAVLVQDNGMETLYYGYTDNQGSLIALTDQNGTVVEKYAYDPWGARRNPADWTLKDTRSSFITNRGYTGHEHLDAFNIINMNGRVYDPVTAQFFSPDPFIQSPGDWMNYNGYSYVMNNPTRAIDPSGYIVVQQNSASFAQCDWSFRGGSYLETSMAWNARGSINYNLVNNRYEYANGDVASENAAMGQLYNGSTVWGSLNGSAATKLLTQIKGGFTLYRFNFSSGYTSYVASIGPIGKLIADPNGGLASSNTTNPTATMIDINTWRNESGGGGRVPTHGNDDAFETPAKILGWLAVIVDGTRGVIADTRIGSDLAYNKIAYNSLLAKGANYLKPVSRNLGYASIALVGLKVLSTHKVSASDGVNLFMAGISFTGAGAVISGLYFVTDIGVGAITGESISERIDDRFGSVTIY